MRGVRGEKKISHEWLNCGARFVGGAEGEEKELGWAGVGSTRSQPSVRMGGERERERVGQAHVVLAVFSGF